jgi:hypothetical protein
MTTSTRKVPDTRDPLVKSILEFRAILTDPRPEFRLQMLLPEKEAYLEILDQALEPDSSLTALKQRSIPEVTMMIFEHIVDQHFAVMSRQAKDLVTWTAYLQKWLLDERALAVHTCTYDMSTRCLMILPEVCRANEFLRVGVGRAWILQSTFVFVGDSDANVRHEIKWLTAFLAHFASGTRPARALVHAVDFPYFSNTMAGKEQIDFMKTLPAVRVARIGIHPVDMTRFAHYGHERRTIAEYVDRLDLLCLCECTFSTLVLVKGPSPISRLFGHEKIYEGHYDSWLRKMAQLLKREFLVRGRGATRVLLDLDGEGERRRDLKELEEVVCTEVGEISNDVDNYVMGDCEPDN